MDGLERDLHGQLRVIRVPVYSAAGRELARRWGQRFTPTFILFDASGRETWRSIGVPDPAEIRQRVETP